MTGSGVLEGREFHARSVAGHDLVERTVIVLSFDAGTIRARAGCNILSAPYLLDDRQLVVSGDGMAMTQMGCDPSLHAQDEWLARFLQDRPRVELNRDDLTLTTEGVKMHLLDRVVADPDRPLVGTRWRVDTVIAGDTATSVLATAHMILELRDDGMLVATATGCTSAEVPFEQVNGKLRFGRFAVDAIGCADPWQSTVDVLNVGEARYSIVASQLTLMAGTIGIGAGAE